MTFGGGPKRVAISAKSASCETRMKSFAFAYSHMARSSASSMPSKRIWLDSGKISANCPRFRLTPRLILAHHAILFFFLLALQVRNAFLHPFRRRCSFKEMIKKLLQATRVVLLIYSLAQAVLLAVVAEHVDLFAQPSQGEEVLDALVPRHRVVFVVIDHQKRRLHAVGAKDRRVLQVTQRVFPEAAADTRLRAFVLKLSREACAPANAAVSAGHV